MLKLVTFEKLLTQMKKVKLKGLSIYRSRVLPVKKSVTTPDEVIVEFFESAGIGFFIFIEISLFYSLKNLLLLSLRVLK